MSSAVEQGYGYRYIMRYRQEKSSGHPEGWTCLRRVTQTGAETWEPEPEVCVRCSAGGCVLTPKQPLKIQAGLAKEGTRRCLQKRVPIQMLSASRPLILSVSMAGAAPGAMGQAPCWPAPPHVAQGLDQFTPGTATSTQSYPGRVTGTWEVSGPSLFVCSSPTSLSKPT